MKTTPLNSVHRALGARMVPFGGWDMPVQYSGVIEEHLRVRSAAGLFDVSHMGEIEVRGAQAGDFLQYLLINDLSTLIDAQVQYSAMCYENGGVVDDLTLYRFSSERYMLCVNASNTEKDFTWIEAMLKHSEFTAVELENRSAQFGQLALQGPMSEKILATLTGADLPALRYYHFVEDQVASVPTIISRTGYTGEDGFELYFPAADSQRLWSALMEAGAPCGMLPVGLGARDTLRLEKKYALYGHELGAEISPLEGGIAWITKLDKGEFVGRAALQKLKADGVPRRLVGLAMTESGIAREGYPVYDGEREVGVVTSGTMSPSLKKGIAIALVEPASAAIGTDLQVGIRARKVSAQVVKTPFVS